MKLAEHYSLQDTFQAAVSLPLCAETLLAALNQVFIAFCQMLLCVYAASHCCQHTI